MEYDIIAAKHGTIKKKEEGHMESFEILLWRRIIKVKWTDCVENEEVFTRIEEEKKLIEVMKKGKTPCLGHILRRNILQRRMIEEKRRGK